MSVNASRRRRQLIADMGLSLWVRRDRLRADKPAATGGAPASAAPRGRNVDRVAQLESMLQDMDGAPVPTAPAGARAAAPPARRSTAVRGAEEPTLLAFTELQCTWVPGVVHLGPPTIGAAQRRFLADLLSALAAEAARPQQLALRPESLPVDLSPDDRIAALLGFVSKRVAAASAQRLLLAGELAPELGTWLQAQPALAPVAKLPLPPLEGLMNDGASKRALWRALLALTPVADATPGGDAP